MACVHRVMAIGGDVDRLVPTWRLLNELPVRQATMAPVERVIRQRQAMSEIGAAAARQGALADLLEHAVQQAADGVQSEMAKIAALQSDGSLLIIAGKNLKPGVAGTARLAGDASNPAGECVSTARIVNIPDLAPTPGIPAAADLCRTFRGFDRQHTDHARQRPVWDSGDRRRSAASLRRAGSEFSDRHRRRDRRGSCPRPA